MVTCSAAPGTTHQGFPIVDEKGALVGVLTRRDLLDPAAEDEASLSQRVVKSPVAIGPDASLREAADVMVRERVGRLPVVAAGQLVGIVTRSDLLDVHQRRIRWETRAVSA